MWINSLKRVVEPPIARIDAGEDRLWSKVEAELGFILPMDYKMYINTYGTGVIADLFRFWNPFSKNVHKNLFYRANEKIDMCLSLVSQFGNIYKYPFFPQPNGMFPFASTDSGEVLFWRITTVTDTWPLYLMDPREIDFFEEYDLSASEFLYKLITLDIKSEMLGEVTLTSRSLFVPEIN